MFIETPSLADNGPEQDSGDVIELAQAATSGGETIGQISSVQGSVFLTHVDGSKSQAADGTTIFQGDIVETGDNGAVGITFADQSTFSLASNGSMVIDEMVYDPATKAGTSALSVAEGVFTFVSGEIAKTGVDAMTITTPVAVIGIRGTSGGGQANPPGVPSPFSLFQDVGGGTGEMTITTQGGAQTLSGANQTSLISNPFVPPTIPVTMPAATMARIYSKAAVITGKVSFAAPAPATGRESAAQKAAGDAFEKAVAEGKPIDAAIAEASDAGQKSTVESILSDNPEHYGSQKSGRSIIEGQKGDILSKVGGSRDPLDPGTGDGLGHTKDLKNQNEDPIDKETKDELEKTVEGALDQIDGQDEVEIIQFFEETFVEGFAGEFLQDIFFDAFTEGFLDGALGDVFFKDTADAFFEDAILFGFDDPFAFEDFSGDFFDDTQFFAGDDFFFDDFEDDDSFFLDPIIFGDEFDLTSGNDILTGGEGNTEYILDQALFGVSVYGGSDVINDSGGIRDRLTFEGVDNVAIRMTEKSGDAGRVTINIATLSTGFDSTGVTSAVNSPVNTLDVTKQVEDLQALDSDFTSFDSGGVLLGNALNVTGSQAGYIVAGSDAQADTIDLSGFSDSTTIGSIIFGKGGNDTLTGTFSEDDIIGGAGDDTIDGNAGTNFLDGGTGNDTFNVTVASSSNDIDGETGTDTLDYSSLTTTVTNYNFGIAGSLSLSRSSGGSDVVFSIENLISTGGDDTFNFNTISLGFTSIDGGTGNDTFTFNTAGAQIAAVIDGGTGTSDSITLNAGTFLAGSGGVQNVETITGSAGNDTVKFVGAQTSVSVDLNGGGDTVTLDNATNSLAITDTETITGGTGVDTLTLNSSGAISLTAGGSADSITITTGAVTFNDLGAGNLNDIVILNGGSVSATVTGNWAATASTDNAVNNNTSFVINAASAGTVNLTNASISNGSGFGYTVLSTGTSTITGSAGADLLTNTSGNSSFAGLGAADTFTAIAGQMTITDLGAGGASDIITLTGGTVSASLAGASVMNGTSNAGAVGDFVINVASTGQLNMGSATGGFTIISTGTSTILGSSSADALTNTSGDSQFSGRGGADTFTATAGQMTITDLGVGDIVELNGGTVVATVQNSFTATSGTDNAGAVGDFTLNVAGVGINVDLTSAGVTGAGYTVASTGTGFVTGSAGADAITNTSGSATITGGGGGDTLVGGTGVDTFVFSATAAANGLDTITTFTAGTDKIDLNAFETVGTLTNLLSATDALAAGEVFYLFSQGTNAADSAAGAIGAIDGTATMTDTAVTSWLVISDDNSTGVFEWTGNGGADGAANDTLTLVATLDAIMTAPADIVIV